MARLFVARIQYDILYKSNQEPKEDLESFYLWWGPSVIYHLGREEMDLYVWVGHLIQKEIRTIQLATSGRDLRKAPDSRCVVAPSPVWLRNH